MTTSQDDADERFRALARAAREAVIIHEQGVVREINDAFTRLLGYERHEIIGVDGVSKLISPESRAEVMRSMGVTGGSGTHEVIVLTKSGERRVVESASEPITYQGRPMRVVTMQDMTERLALDVERRRTAALLQAIVDNTNQLVFVKDLQGKMLLGNAAFTGEGSVADAASSGDVLVGAGPVTVESVVQTEDGERRFLTTKFLLRDDAGVPYAFGGIATDITERRRSTDLLAAISRDTLGAVGQAFFDALARTLAKGLDAEFCMVGELLPGAMRIRSLAAVERGELSPTVEYDIAGTPTETILARKSCTHRDRLHELYPGDAHVQEHGLRGYLGVPILGSDGQPVGVVAALFTRALGVDTEAAIVTVELVAARAAAELERIQAARMQEEIRAGLERRVVERTAELVATNEELEAFAYSVSHDLRAPLRHIDGFAELLERSARDQLPAEARRHLDTIRRSSKRMSTLIDDLLSFSRTGRSTLKPLRFSSRDLVEQVVRESTTSDGAAGSSIEWSLGTLPEVEADRPMLSQVLHNLVDNAVKYSRQRRPSRIEIGARDEGADWEFHVRDNGVGFDPRYVDQLFGVFRRLHRAEEFEGNGIGLASVRRIVHRHGGRVWAEGRPDDGATFYFTLPKKPRLERRGS